jgi:cysteinyl-tRNA synthetase
MRREKLWADADLLREQISNAGYEVEDTPLGPKVKIQKR